MMMVMIIKPVTTTVMGDDYDGYNNANNDVDDNEKTMIIMTITSPRSNK